MSDFRFTESGGLRAAEVATDLRALESYVAGVVYADDFNRADTTAGGVGLGTNWVDPSGAWNINSNHATKNILDHHVKYAVDLGTPDHWVEVDIAGTDSDYLLVNARGEADRLMNGYGGFLNPAASTQVDIGKWNGGTGSAGQVGTYSTVTTGSHSHDHTGTIRLEVEGDEQRLYRNGTLVATSNDTSVTTGNYVGLNCFAANTGTIVYDNFRCGPLPYTPP